MIRIVNHFDILGRIQYKSTNFEGNQCEIVVISWNVFILFVRNMYNLSPEMLVNNKTCSAFVTVIVEHKENVSR